MVFSTQKPAEIRILNVQDDIFKRRVKVRYAFRFNIKEATQTIETEQGTQEIQGYEYIEQIYETEFDLILKSALPDILKVMYEKANPIVQENIQLAEVEIPKEISLS